MGSTTSNSGKKGLPVLVIAIFSCLIYASAILNDYALDDLMVIKGNAFTAKGISGIPEIFSYDSFAGFWGKDKTLVAGGRYRPLSIASFAIEKSLFGGFNPTISHILNILLYAVTGILIFIILRYFVKTASGQRWYLTFPFLAAMFFIAHPVHTEVVANIKGRDEIFALLFSLVSLWLYLLYTRNARPWLIILASFTFLLGLLSKENAILFVVIVPLTLYFFTKTPLKKSIVLAIPLAATALLFMVIRYLALGQVISTQIPREILNNPFLDATTSQKFGSIMITLGMYLRLLVFPHPLTHDYYPYQIPLVSLSDIRSLVPLIIHILLIAYCIRRFRKKDLIVYGIIFYLLTLLIVSNLLFPVGTFMNERFIYMPSLGFIILLSCLLTTKLPSRIRSTRSQYRVITAISLILLIFWSLKTFTRNPVWKDDFTLFTTDVLVSENSIKCNISAGGDYLKKAQSETDSVKRDEYFSRSQHYLEKSLTMAPASVNALILYGNLNALYLKDYKKAIGQYLTVLKINSQNQPALTNILRMLENIDNSDFRYKLEIYRFLTQIAPANVDVVYNLGRLYGQSGANLDSAAWYLHEAIRISPGELRAHKDLGIVLSMKGDYRGSMESFMNALKIDPNDVQIKQNMEITRQLISRNPK